jgi:hypothetical protein
VCVVAQRMHRWNKVSRSDVVVQRMHCRNKVSRSDVVAQRMHRRNKVSRSDVVAQRMHCRNKVSRSEAAKEERTHQGFAFASSFLDFESTMQELLLMQSNNSMVVLRPRHASASHHQHSEAQTCAFLSLSSIDSASDDSEILPHNSDSDQTPHHHESSRHRGASISAESMFHVCPAILLPLFHSPSKSRLSSPSVRPPSHHPKVHKPVCLHHPCLALRIYSPLQSAKRHVRSLTPPLPHRPFPFRRARPGCRPHHARFAVC